MKLFIDVQLPSCLAPNEHAKALTDDWALHARQRYNAAAMLDRPAHDNDWVVACNPARLAYWKGRAPIIWVVPDGYEVIEPVLDRAVWALRALTGESPSECRKVLEKYGTLDQVPAKAKKWWPIAQQAIELLKEDEQDPTIIEEHEDPARRVRVVARPDYTLCTDVPAALLACENSGVYAVDFEYGGESGDDDGEEDKDYSRSPVGVSLSWAENQAVYIPLGHEGYAGNHPAPRHLISQLMLLGARVRPVMWNSKADTQIEMQSWGNGVDDAALFLFRNPPDDAMLVSYMLSLQPLSLKKRTWFDFGHRMQAITELIGKKPHQVPFSKVPVEKAVPYGGQDADWTRRHWLDKWPALYDKGKKLYEEIERPLAVILAHAELRGIPFDREQLTQMWVEDVVEKRNLERMIFALAGVEWNLASDQQTACVLYNKLGLPPQVPTKKFRPSVSADALYPIATRHPVVPLLLRWTKLDKLEVAFYQKLLSQPDDWVHCQMNQAVVDTGRLSSSRPNMQQNPPKVRKAIVAPEGMNIGAADESQLELRIMARLSGSRIMLDAYMSDPPKDLHELTRVQTGLDDRRPAKIANFLTQYGGAAPRFQIALAKNGIYWDLGRCDAFLRTFFAGRPEIQAYWRTAIEFAEENGYAETVEGRRRYIEDINNSRPDAKGHAERQAINHPVQGTGSDKVKRAMVMAWRAVVESGGWMPLQVHDEILTVNDPRFNDDIREILDLHMTTPNTIAPVPLKADIAFGHSWGEVH